jgi:hypothetical protein
MFGRMGARFGGMGAVAGAGAPALIIDDLDDLDNHFSICALKLVRAAYGSGNLVRLRRVSDNVELDYAAGVDGWIDSAAITTWLGGSSARVVTVYDQSGSSRSWTQATAGTQPFLDLSASHPRLDFQGAQTFTGAATQLGFLNNRTGNTAVHVRVHDVIPPPSVPAHEVYFTINSSGVNRFATTARTTSGNMQLSTRRQDADGGNNVEGFVADTTWRAYIARADWTNGTRYHTAGSSSATSTPGSGGNSSATNSQSAFWGARSASEWFDGKATALFLFADALTDAEITAMATFCADLTAA